MASNLQLVKELPASIPNADSSTKLRLFIDNTGVLNTKDNLGVVTPITGGGSSAWIHNAPRTVGSWSAVIQETVKADVDTGIVTITLPTAIGNTGLQVKVVSLSDAITPNACNITTVLAQTINGLASYTLTTPRERVTVESDGANWLVVD